MNNGKICVSVCAENANEFIEKIERAAKVADVVELRFDCLDATEFDCLNLPRAEIVLNKILARNYDKPLLAAFRPKEQGGRREISLEERRNVWNSGYDVCFWAGDFEEDVVEDSWSWLWENRICSFHDFSGVSQNLSEVYRRLKATEVDVLKIAVQANDATDGLALMNLLERAKAESRDLIPIAMGEHGVWTRILGLARGAFMTFASLDENSKTAPGQLTAREMIDVYRVKELDAKTEIYGLVAGSVEHSVSPEMHNAAFKFHDLNAVYVPFAVKDLGEFVRRMVNQKTREIDWNLRGFSVTLPHKVEIIKYLDSVGETARATGAVNTVKILENGELHGFNTDAAGFVEPLKNAYGDLNNVKVAVLGAGGAARAVVYALEKENARITVFARNAEKAKDLQKDFAIEIRETRFTIHDSQFTDFDIVVNATPLGTKKGGFENETAATAEQLEGVKLVYDLVYNPFQTKLMHEAAKVFVPTIGGLAMLVAQAIGQQKIWTGKDAPLREMSRAALDKLG